MVDGSGIFTNIDAFVKYLNEHGETESTVLAQNMGVSERNIEEWSKVLENSKMARITYKLGKMYVAPISAGSAGPVETKQIVEVKKAVVGSEIGGQMADVSRLTQRIEEFNKYITASENVINTNSGAIRDALGKISKLQADAAKSYEEIKGKKAEVEKFSGELGAMMDTLSGASALGTVTENRKNSVALMEDMKTKIHNYEDNLHLLVKSYENGVKEERKNLLEFVKNATTEIAALRELLKAEENNLKKFDSTYKSYSNESAKAKQMVEKNKTEIMDGASQAKAEMDSIFQAADAEWKKLDVIFSKAKEGLTGFEAVQGEIEQLKKDIAETARETSEIKGQIEQLSQQMKGVEGRKPADRQSAVDEIDSDSRQTSKRIAKQEEKINQIKEKVDELASKK